MRHTISAGWWPDGNHSSQKCCIDYPEKSRSQLSNPDSREKWLSNCSVCVCVVLLCENFLLHQV